VSAFSLLYAVRTDADRDYSALVSDFKLQPRASSTAHTHARALKIDELHIAKQWTIERNLLLFAIPFWVIILIPSLSACRCARGDTLCPFSTIKVIVAQRLDVLHW
jgi:hypothetical protein